MATTTTLTAEMHTQQKEKACCPFPIHHRTVTSPLPSARPTRSNASQMTLSPASRNWLGVDRSGEVHNIFTLASLPSDHPHAFQRVKRRLSDVGDRIAEIATSPKLSEKVKMKLGRKSCRSLRPPEMHVDGANDAVDAAGRHPLPDSMRTGQFDQDAHSLNSSDLERVLEYMNIDSTIAAPSGRPWLGSSVGHVPCSPLVRSEEMRAIGTSSSRGEDMREVTKRPLDDVALPRSVSSPMLGPWNQGTSSKLRKTRSAYPLSAVTDVSGDSTSVTNVASPRMKARGKSNSGMSFATLLSGKLSEKRRDPHGTLAAAVPGGLTEYPVVPTRRSSLTLKTAEPASPRDDTRSRVTSAAAWPITGWVEDEPQESNLTTTTSHQVAPSWDLQTAIEQNVAPPLQREDSTHLDADLIRRATECRSAMSGDETEMPDGPDLEGFLEQNRWNHTRSTTPPILSRQQSQRTRHSQRGSTGTRYPQGSNRACVYSPSIYSRPSSAEEETQQPAEGLNNMVVDWPLNGIERSDADDASQQASPRSGQDKPIPPTPSKSDATASSSPAKKMVKKRRSIFRFLRPGSRKAIRSLSSPLLLGKAAPRVSSEYDGPFDERDTLTVQYELSDNPRHRRSVTATGVPQDRRPSLNDVERGPSMVGGSNRRPSAVNNSPPSPPQGRRPTLAEYQLGLSLAGDSRRRPSSVGPSAIGSAINLATIAKLEEIREDDDPVLQPSRLNRKLSRANAMDEAGDTVMGKAMKRHIDEKALFRSESKRRESSAVAQPPPVFTAPSFGGSSGLAVTEEEEDEAAAEDEQGVPATTGGHQLNTRAPSRSGPRLEHDPSHTSPLCEQSPADYFPTEPTMIISTKLSDRSSVSPQSADGFQNSPKSTRIGTALKSWSKFPSHTRPDRAASAGAQDNVITRDFAPDIEAAESQPESTSPKGKHPHAITSPKSSKSLIRSPSKAYHGFIAYYTDLLTRAGFHGQNRRTSVAMSQGTLVHPELEMLAPVTGSEGHVPAYRHLLEIEQHIEEQVSKAVHKPAAEPSGDIFRQDSFSKKKEGADSPFRQGSFRFQQHVPAPDEIVEEEEEQDPLGGGDGAADDFSRVYRALVPSPAGLGSRQSSESESVSTVGRSIVRVRKFPSVTVLDDGRGCQGSLRLRPKGWGREASGGGDGLVRDCTEDLVNVLIESERMERERLVGVGSALVKVA